MFRWLKCILILGYFSCAFGKIVINEITGTDSAIIGTNTTTLTCDYDYQNETGVEVKWFFNNHIQIYHWIPTLTTPKAMGPFSDIMEVDNTSIHFTETNRNLTGDYTCKISSDENEEFKTQTMVPYEQPTLIEFFLEDETETLVCIAYEIYPKPVITINGSYIVKRNNTLPVTSQSIGIMESDDYFYNVTATATLDLSSVTESMEFFCTIVIENTNYNETRFAIYKISSNESITTENTILFDTASTFETSLNAPTTHSTLEGQMSSSPTVWLMFVTILAIISLNS